MEHCLFRLAEDAQSGLINIEDLYISPEHLRVLDSELKKAERFLPETKKARRVPPRQAKL